MSRQEPSEAIVSGTKLPIGAALKKAVKKSSALNMHSVRKSKDRSGMSMGLRQFTNPIPDELTTISTKIRTRQTEMRLPRQMGICG